MRFARLDCLEVLRTFGLYIPNNLYTLYIPNTPNTLNNKNVVWNYQSLRNWGRLLRFNYWNDGYLKSCNFAVGNICKISNIRNYC